MQYSSYIQQMKKLEVNWQLWKMWTLKWNSESSALKKNQAKSEQYSRRNNTELSGIPNDVPEDNLEKFLIDIFHDSDLEIESKDIEGCHRLPVSRYSRDSNKRVIVKFVNRKHPEGLLQNKKSISGKDFSHLKIHG